jgi:hypothetical protein
MDFLKSAGKGALTGLGYGIGILSAAVLVGAGIVIGMKAGEDINSNIYPDNNSPSVPEDTTV